MPEPIYTIYALNKIGAVADFIDIRSTPERIASHVKSRQSKILLIMAFMLKPIAKVADSIEVNKIVVLRGCDSCPTFVTFWYRLGEYFNGRKWAAFKNKKFEFWNKFILNDEKTTEINAPIYTDKTIAIFQTSGTIGNPKGVQLSDYHIIATSYYLKPHLNDLKESDTVLCVMSAFAFYGFVTTIHMPLSSGLCITIIPIFKHKDFEKILLRHKHNHIFGVPSHWEFVLNKEENKADISFIKSVCVAGEVNYDKLLNVHFPQ